MSTFFKGVYASVLGIAVSVGAHAELSKNVGNAYIGLKAGMLEPDDIYVHGNSNYVGPLLNTAERKKVDVDNATAYGIYAGYQFSPNIGLEVEYAKTNDADFKFVDQYSLSYGRERKTTYDGEYDVSHLGLFGTYKQFLPQSKLYAKGKAGFIRAKVKADWNIHEHLEEIFPIDIIVDDWHGPYKYSNTSTDIALGLGLGFAATPNVNIEGEVTVRNGDYDGQMMTIGVTHKF